MEVICELVGIAGPDRARWREYGAAIAAGHGDVFATAIPGIIDGAREAVARSRATPGDDLLSDLVRAQEDDRLTDAELITLVWHLVLAGQTPTNLVPNAVAALLDRPELCAALRRDPGLMPAAVEELTRWCGPQLLAVPRHTRCEVVIGDVVIGEGEPVLAAIVAANRDPRAFPDPETLDVHRTPGPHLAYGHGPHFCLGAALARVQTQVVLTVLLDRFPDLRLAAEPGRAPDPGTWRLTSLPVLLR